MVESIQNKFFSLSRIVVFEVIGAKLKPGSLKGLMDYLFVIFEKISRNFKFLSDLYLDLYEEIINNEIKIGDIKKNDSILVIGCGSLPATTVLLYKKTRANILAIDIDPKAVRKAKLFLKENHLDKKIMIENKDGLNCDFSIFDIIFVLYGVKKQRKIFEKISNDINDKTRVIFRTAKENEDKIEKVKIDLGNNFRISKKISTYSLGPIDSFLLAKK